MSTKDTVAESAPTGKVEVGQNISNDVEHEPITAIDLPPGWMYRQYRLFGYTLPWYASPKIQLGMVAFVCFMCPGMFNALGGLGGGGKTDPTLADNMVSETPTRGSGTDLADFYT